MWVKSAKAMGQHPKVIGAMVETATRMGTGAGGRLTLRCGRGQRTRSDSLHELWTRHCAVAGGRRHDHVRRGDLDLTIIRRVFDWEIQPQRENATRLPPDTSKRGGTSRDSPLPRWLKNQHTWDAAHRLGTGRDGAFRTAKPCIQVQFRAWPRQNFSEGWPHQPPRATTGRPAQAKPRRTPRNFRRFAAFKAGPALLYALRAREVLFPGSSAVEQPAVNRLVAGSNPARGANKINNLRSPAERYCALWIRPGYGYGYDEPRAF